MVGGRRALGRDTSCHPRFSCRPLTLLFCSIFTHLGIYFPNEHKIQPTIYRSDGLGALRSCSGCLRGA